jgi:hypothetical protein
MAQLPFQVSNVVNYFPLLIIGQSRCYQLDSTYHIVFRKISPMSYFADVKINVVIHPLTNQIMNIITNILEHRVELGMTGEYSLCISVSYQYSHLALIAAMHWVKVELKTRFPYLKLQTYQTKMTVTPQPHY